MSWTYTPGPSPSDTSRLRLWLGDTDQTKSYTLSDEEYSMFLADYPTNIWQAAATAGDSILAKMKAIASSKTIGNLSISFNTSALTSLESVIKRLRAKADVKAVRPYVGGTSKSIKAGYDQDTDRVQPAAKVDDFSYPAPQPSTATWGGN